MLVIFFRNQVQENATARSNGLDVHAQRNGLARFARRLGGRQRLLGRRRREWETKRAQNPASSTTRHDTILRGLSVKWKRTKKVNDR